MYKQAHNMIYSIRKKKILQVKIKKNIKSLSEKVNSARKLKFHTED